MLLTVEDSQLQLAKEVTENGLSTRQLEGRIRELQPKLTAPTSEPIEAPAGSSLEPRAGFEPAGSEPATYIMYFAARLQI